MITTSHSIEILETRIAPALFFVGTASVGDNALTVHKGDALAGTSTAETTARDAANSTVAVLLAAGDSLVFDADNSHTFNAGDTLLMKVSAGKAMVFLTDGSFGATTGAFDPNEITGLAVSDKFNAQVLTDINGSVATALDATGAFTGSGNTLPLMHSSIAGFKSSGQIADGGVLAGGSISNFSADAPIYNTGTSGISIDGFIASGIQTIIQSASFNGGGTTFTPSFQINPGEPGGSISGVTLTHGAKGILAGFGGASETGNGGAGGSISKITVNESPVGMTVIAGTGGSGFSKGGIGGSITGTTLKTTAPGASGWTVNSGLGGSASAFKGTAGSGGSILASSLETADVNGNILVQGGGGGFSPSGKAGAGGSVNGFTFTNHGIVSGSISIFSGAGGDLQSADGRSNHAGNGGAISMVTLNNLGGIGGFSIASGEGGHLSGGQGTGGNSGAVSKITIHSSAADTGNNLIHSGQGGGPLANPGFGPFPAQVTANGNGGNSGNLSNIVVTDTFGASNPFEIYAGVPLNQFAGGGKSGPVLGMEGIGAAAKGGNIGSVTGVSLDGASSKFIIGKSDAAGSASSNLESAAGAGGSISNITGKIGTLDILAPSGGSAGTSGHGGAGGSISGIHLTAVSQFVHLIAAGNGGSGKIGGVGGSVSDVNVPGDIGNFSADFGLSTSSSTMGGLVAGMHGTGGGLAANGGVTKITASRIAAILAGMPAANEIGYDNAVSKIAKISATVIGADVNGNTTFNFNEGSGSTVSYEPDNAGTATDGDTAVDGLVIVKQNSGASSLSVTPLKLIEVP